MTHNTSKMANFDYDQKLLAILGYGAHSDLCHHFKDILVNERFGILMGNNTDEMSVTPSEYDMSKRSSLNQWYQYIIPVICIIGIIGNVLNLIVLTRRRLLSRMDDLEKSATYGLVGLAFSDMMFCIAVFPHSFIDIKLKNSAVTEEHVYQLYYQLYGVGLINLFLMNSTWLIVYMALSRYVVVVYPFQARWTLDSAKTLLCIIIVYLSSICLTLPFFIHVKVATCRDITDNEIYYEYVPRWTDLEALTLYMRWVWPVLADFIPLVILTCINFRLIRELRKATSRRRTSCRGQKVQDSSHRVNLTLFIIVLMLCLLVSPSEILRYINPYDMWGTVGHTIMIFSNICQTINFAVNFILYCVVSETFRSTVKTMLTCFLRKDNVTDNTDNGSPLTEKTTSLRRSSKREGGDYQKIAQPLSMITSNGL